MVDPEDTIDDVAVALALSPTISTRNVVDVSLDTTLKVLLIWTSVRPPVVGKPLSDKNTPVVIFALDTLWATADPADIVWTSRFLVPLFVVILASKVTPISEDIAVIEVALADIRPSLKGCHVLPFHLLISLLLPVSIQISPTDVAVGVELCANVCTVVGAKGTQVLPLHLCILLLSLVFIQMSPTLRSLVELFCGWEVPTKLLFFVSTLVVRADIAVAFADTPETLLLTVDSSESILDEPADPDPYTSVSSVDIAEAFAPTPVDPLLTVFCNAVIACELEVVNESLTLCQSVPSYL